MAGLDMTRRPLKLRLGALDYRIFFQSEIESEDDDGDIERRTGEFSESEQVIRIQTGNAPGYTASTLVHEALHAMFSNTPLRFTAGWTPEVEEAIVVALEGQVLELMTSQSNRPIRRWLKSLVH